MKKILSVLLMLMLLLVMVTGCGKTQDKAVETEAPKTETEEKVEVEAEVEAEEEVSEPRTLVDGTGKEVVINKNPERIVATFFNDVDLLETFGVTPIAVTDSAYLQYYEHLSGNPDIAKIEDIGTASSPNWEKINELKPDFIMLQFMQEHFQEDAEKIAPSYVCRRFEGDEWQEQMLVLGEVLGKEDKAKEIIADTLKIVEDTREELSKYKDKTFVFIRPEDIADIYLMGGARRPHAEDGLNLSRPEGLDSPGDGKITIEALVELDPDYIILQSFPENNEKFKKHLEETTVGQSLKAVKNDNVYKLSFIIAGSNPNATKYLCEEMLKIVEKSTPRM